MNQWMSLRMVNNLIRGLTLGRIADVTGTHRQYPLSSLKHHPIICFFSFVCFDVPLSTCLFSVCVLNCLFLSNAASCYHLNIVRSSFFFSLLHTPIYFYFFPLHIISFHCLPLPLLLILLCLCITLFPTPFPLSAYPTHTSS